MTQPSCQTEDVWVRLPVTREFMELPDAMNQVDKSQAMAAIVLYQRKFGWDIPPFTLVEQVKSARVDNDPNYAGMNIVMLHSLWRITVYSFT